MQWVTSEDWLGTKNEDKNHITIHEEGMLVRKKTEENPTQFPMYWAKPYHGKIAFK